MRAPEALKRIAEWATHAGMTVEPSPRGRCELCLIEDADESSPGYDFHVVLTPIDSSMTNVEVAVLNHTVTLAPLMEERLKRLRTSIERLTTE
jgi:hypothetical protein